jgi:tRNA U34 5-methylaminomethyl-2-thiouridine-forming methyltransferase MnmC
MPITLVETRDQSHTLYVPELDETYHSRNGAVEEAMYVYIGRGVQDWVEASFSIKDRANGDVPSFNSAQDDTVSNSIRNHPSEIQILEVGFGTGLNAWLTALESEKLNIQCTYHSLETFPIEMKLVEQLNYTEKSNEPEKQLFSLLHQAIWNIPIPVTPLFTIKKELVSLLEYLPKTTFDVIYFDAFAPEKQPEMWTEAVFQKLYDCLKLEGVIVTYSSKGDIKRLWKKIGFEVERLPGPPMKRHMLRGKKCGERSDKNAE